MNIKYARFFIFLLSFPGLSYTQIHSQSEKYIISLFEEIGSIPNSISFNNALEINNHGGHLQGIQFIEYKRHDYYVLSGSSNSYSYYSIVKMGKENKVISINKILEKPFKHAGGFQIYDNLMAIGIEDNNAKNQSKVFIFQIDNPEKPPTEPLVIIERHGTYKRSTAGCVGITIKGGNVLVVVGDWDTKHLDIYKMNKKSLGSKGATMELALSLNSEKMDKTGWVDDDWLSYQNINFIQDLSKNLYLVGMTTNDNNEDIVDLFAVEDTSGFKLTKIYSRQFEENSLTKFRWGSGIRISGGQKIKILSCGKNIEEKSLINVYKN